MNAIEVAQSRASQPTTVRVTNLNPDSNIGASAWCVEVDGHHLLLDAGVHPARLGRDSLPLYKLIRGLQLDAIAVSHCHLDHIGSLPVAVREHPHAQVLMTTSSYSLAGRVLHNSVNVMLRQRGSLGIRDYPLFTHADVEEMEPLFQGFRYNREIVWGSPHTGRRGARLPTLEFHDAGHVLGSAGVLVRGRKESLFYTGDVCFHDQTLLRSARFEKVKADVLILETTRGGRALPEGFSRASEEERLVASIERVLKRRGSVLVPAFGLGRTQEVLARLALWMRSGRLRRQAVHIGGLGRVFTEIYDQESHRAHRHHPSLQLRDALELTVLAAGEAGSMRLGGGRIFVVTAGMMTEGTAAHDLAARMMRDPRHGIFFVGYADPDSPGGRLKASSRGEPFIFSAATGEVSRGCEVAEFDLTAHANRDDLLAFVAQAGPRAVLLGHGDQPAREWFEEQLAQRHPGLRVIQPAPGKVSQV